MPRQTHCSCGNPFRYQMDRLRDCCRACREVRWLALKAQTETRLGRTRQDAVVGRDASPEDVHLGV